MHLNPAKPKILIVDDSAFARRNVRLVLQGTGYEVEEAIDGMQCIESYFLKTPDLVVLDNVMPGMSGIEVLKRIREINPQACVVMLTSDVQDQTRKEAMNLGAMGYLVKPVNKAEMLALLANCLNGGPGQKDGLALIE
jgi:CheY-like chemotaxis protein